MPRVKRRIARSAAVLPVLVALVFGGRAPAADLAYESDLVARAAAMTDAALRPLGPDGHPLPVKCGTPFILEVRDAWPQLTSDARMALGEFATAQRPQLENEELYDVVTPEGTIRIHFTRTGPNAIDMSLGVGEGDVPVYILKCAEFFEETVAKLVTELGYRFPISDQLADESESPEFDVFFVELGTGYYGQTWPEDEVESSDPGVYLSTCYIELNRDFSVIHPYENTPLDAMAVTVTHEFHHAIQWSYDYYETEKELISGNTYRSFPWFHELTSTYLEDVVFDDINDYYLLVPYFFRFPWYSLRLITSVPDESIHPYASAIWGHFLAQKYGHGLMVDVWEQCGKTFGFNTFSSFESALSARGSSFADEWAEFLVWNYFTGPRARDWSYDEGAHFGDRRTDFDGSIPDTLVAFYDTYPVEDSAHLGKQQTPPRRPDELGAAYMFFFPGAGETVDTFKLLLSSDEFDDWMVVTAGIIGDQVPQITYTTNTFDPITVPGWTVYDELLVVITPFSGQIKEADFKRNIGFQFEVQDTFETSGESSAIAKIFSNPITVASGGSDEPFRVKVALADPVEVSMYIYTADGTLIRGGADDNRDGNEMYFKPGTRNPTLVWAGTNRDNNPVASGIYLGLIQIGDKREIVKIAVKNMK